jgi:Holliday junction resolvase RusA-like endonuclease
VSSTPRRLVLVLDEFVRKNERHAVVGKLRPRLITTSKYKKWCSKVAEQVKKQGWPVLDKGRWRLTVHTVWPTLRHLDSPVPHGDSDASLSAIKDALERCGVLDNDARIIEDRTANHYVKGVRRLIAVMERVDRDPTGPDDELDALLAEAAA